MFNFGSSLWGDNGQGITCTFKTRFLAEMGKSVTEQFRRLFIDATPVVGLTAPLSIDFFQDYGSSVVLSRTMYQTPFQSRIDFGIPAKSLAFELGKNGASTFCEINGFTVESRLQRKV